VLDQFTPYARGGKLTGSANEEAVATTVPLSLPVINAHLGIVSHVPYVLREGAARIDPAEWRVLQIFARHFRRVTLIRPRVADSGQRGWVCLPDGVGVRTLREPQHRFANVLCRAGVTAGSWSRKLKGLDVVCGRLPGYEAYYALRFAKRHGLPTIASLHGDWREAYRVEWNEGWKAYIAPVVAHRADRIFRWVARRVDCLFTVGETLRRRYAEHRDDVCVFANYCTQREDLLRREDSCDSSEVKVLFVGDLVRRKGVHHLIRAVHRLRSQGRAVRLTLVGSGRDGASLSRMIDELDLQESVDFAGRVPMSPKLYDYYATHDVFVLPSVGAEGCPKVVVEAMAKGCPVIATTVGSVPFMIQHEENGLLVRPGRSDEIVQALERIIDDRDLRTRLIRQGLDYAAANTYEMQMQRVGKALRDFLLPRFGE